MEFEIDLGGTVQDDNDYMEQTGNKFIRSKQDNKMLLPLQIKDNFFDIVDKDATLWGDFDGIPFKTASSVEEDYIVVALLQEEDCTIEDKLRFVGSREFKNRTDFKGSTKGDKIGVGSFLYDLNLLREVNGLTPYTLSDFSIDKCKRLKYENGVTIDGIKFENSLEVCKYYIDTWLEACLLQTRLKKLKCVIGSGITHRHSVLLPHQYKSERDDSRPILLSEARQYLIDAYDTVVAPPLMEADEIVDAMAARSYDYARSTGTKIKIVKAANDKDSRSKRGVLFDWAKTFHFNNPQCWLINDFDEDVGCLEIHKGEVKGGGSVFFAYQILIGDTIDEYSPRKFLPEDFRHNGKGYGDESFYRDFVGLTTSKDVWQKVVDKYFEWFPKGLQYTAWDGSIVDEDTLAYLQKHYAMAYMLESKDDKSTIMDLLDKFGVDYSALVGNNKQSYDDLLSLVNNLKPSLNEIITLLEDKSGKVVDKNERISKAIALLKQLT